MTKRAHDASARQALEIEIIEEMIEAGRKILWKDPTWSDTAWGPPEDLIVEVYQAMRSAKRNR